MNEKKIKSEKAAQIRSKLGDKIFIGVVYGMVILVALCCAYPLYYTVLASISNPHSVARGELGFLPVGFQLDAYKEVFKNSTIWRGYANTILYTVAGTCFNLFLTIPCAYAMSKKRMFGRSLLMTIFIITMYFGGGMIPYYLLVKNLGLINTRWILIIGGGLSVSNVIVTRTYFQNNIPESLYEAARIDGASEFYIFFKLALPLSAPILAVITLYYAVGHWGSYFSAMIYTTDSALQPLQLVLRRILILNESLLTEATGTDASTEVLMAAKERQELAYAMKYALVFISSVPMLIVYPFVQKHFVKGMMVGSLKG